MSSPKLPEIIYLNGLRFVQPSEAQPLEVDQEFLKGRCLMSQNDLPEIVYLNGVRFARVSEPQPGEEDQEALIRTLTRGAPIEVKPGFQPPATDAEGWMGKPHPVSKQDAINFARSTVGSWRLRTVISQRNDWWNKLRAARTPEEKLTCERMITALSEAIGLHQHDLGAQLFKDNPHNRSSREPTEEELAESERREVNKWR